MRILDCFQDKLAVAAQMFILVLNHYLLHFH